MLKIGKDAGSNVWRSALQNIFRKVHRKVQIKAHATTFYLWYETNGERKGKRIS